MNVQVYLRLNPSTFAATGFAIPSLEQLLAKGSVTKNTDIFESVLCKAFGLTTEWDWPAAALSWLGEGNDPENYFWLYADPVNLQLQRDHFSLNLPAPLPLSTEESTALSASLNQHFSGDGLRFFIGSSGQWYLRLPQVMSIGTSSVAQAANRDVRNFMPRGDGAEQLQMLINEVQMLLHEHPVNTLREENGQPIINSLWFSLTGSIPASPCMPAKTVFTDGVFAKGLAKLGGEVAAPIPLDFEYPKDSHQDIALVLDNDSNSNMQDCERWFMATVAGLRSRKIKQSIIHIFMLDQHIQAELKPRDLWKFWRKTQPLSSYFAW
ncbi:MAG TPA: hypothetical protein VEA39_01005 [Methylophilaceae bacterium]|nr:hypothetical protein [Methylophilaceae bacterium]